MRCIRESHNILQGDPPVFIIYQYLSHCLTLVRTTSPPDGIFESLMIVKRPSPQCERSESILITPPRSLALTINALSTTIDIATFRIINSASLRGAQLRRLVRPP
jgi:hypothetical protein